MGTLSARWHIPFRPRDRRKRRLLVGLAVMVALMAQVLATAPPARADAIYSQEVTLPVPPASSFVGNSGGDGWDISLSGDRVYNIFHHGPLQLACLNQVDATSCWTPQLIGDGSGRTFYASHHSGADLDQASGLIHTYTARNDGVGGVLCLDPTKPDQSASPYCGFAELTGPGEAQFNDYGPGAPMLVGTRYYAYNFSSGAAGAQNKLLCYDFSTSGACAGQPYDIDFGGAFPTFERSAHVVIGGKLLIPNGDFSGATRVACFDPSTGTECAGSWPVTTVDASNFYLAGPPFPVLDTSGAVVGACMPGALTCFALDGSIIAAPSGIPANMGGHYYTGGAVNVGARVFTPGYDPDRVDCYDYSVGAVCSGFPKVLSNANLPYTVNTDPFRPTCVWVNSDSGSAQIQAFDAFSGAACGQGGIRVLVSQFVVNQTQCHPTAYQSLELVAPAPDTYTSASVEFLTTNGGSTGIPDQAFVAGVVDLTSLGLEGQPSLPQFLISVTGGPSNIGQVTLRLNWKANYDPACSGPDTEIQPASTTVGTTITGGGVTGSDVSVPTGDAATANAALGGENAAGATGSVTYTWYSDNACTTVAAQGNPQAITTNGVLPDSAPVTLPNGTYYVVASYSGDAGNQPSTSTCGEAVLEVGSSDNEAPVVDAGPDQSITFGATVGLQSSFGDPDGGPDWTIDIDWGDGTTGQASTAAVTGAIIGGHQYLVLGTYSVRICVTDQAGATGCDTMVVTVTNTAGKVTGGVSTVAGSGKGGFVVQNSNGVIKGNLQYQDAATRFHATTMTALAVSADKKSAWFAGVGKDGRSFVAYVEDNGEPGATDIFRLWINGVLYGGSGAMQGGNIQIH